MLLQNNPKKTTPPNTISTHRHILTIVILGQTTQIFTKSKTKKAAPESYFVWFHATMLFCGLFSGLLLNLLANKFQGDTFTVHDSGRKGFRAV